MSTQAQMNAIIGRAIECSIGEPWDFESEAGEGRLTGVVLATTGAERVGKEVVLCKVSTFFAKGHQVNLIQAGKRYVEPGDLIEQLLAGGSIGCNLAYRYSWHDLASVDFIDTQRSIDDGSWLIGSIRLI